MPELPGHERRTQLRRVIGKPGSIRRWLLVNLIGLPIVLASMNLYLVIAAVLLSAMWVMYLREILVEGDEDEMRAWVRWQTSRRNPDRAIRVSQPEPVDPSRWFNTRVDTFVGVPSPPVLDCVDESPALMPNTADTFDQGVGSVGDCIFCDIVAGNVPCHKIWEDDEHLAFLSIFPNTRGFTVVIPKQHYSSYAFDLPDDVLAKLVLASKKVARLLDSKLEDVGRTGMFFEGYGVDHVHSKLSPMHGTADITGWQPIESRVDKYFDRYEGYLSSHDWERADDEELARLAKLIRE